MIQVQKVWCYTCGGLLYMCQVLIAGYSENSFCKSTNFSFSLRKMCINEGLYWMMHLAPWRYSALFILA